MIHEHGSPSLFLTFSCAEYDSIDIASYLHKVNNVPDGYNYAQKTLCQYPEVQQKFPQFLLSCYNKGRDLR